MVVGYSFFFLSPFLGMDYSQLLYDLYIPFCQASIENGKGSRKEVISAQQAEDLKMKEKRKREREVVTILSFSYIIFLISDF